MISFRIYDPRVLRLCCIKRIGEFLTHSGFISPLMQLWIIDPDPDHPRAKYPIKAISLVWLIPLVIVSEYFLLILFFITDMIRRRSLRTRAIKLLVLDEADEMLNKGVNGSCSQLLFSELNNFKSWHFNVLFSLSGFKEQIYDVYRYLPPATQASYSQLCRDMHSRNQSVIDFCSVLHFCA